jgi:hypothetical protein
MRLPVEFSVGGTTIYITSSTAAKNNFVNHMKVVLSKCVTEVNISGISVTYSYELGSPVISKFAPGELETLDCVW